jgi:HxlR-like helix-turn-helix protein
MTALSASVARNSSVLWAFVAAMKASTACGLQLNQLEEHELLSKRIYAELPPRVEYSLTDLGQSVLPVIAALGRWGDDHQEHLRRVIAKI